MLHRLLVVGALAAAAITCAAACGDDKPPSQQAVIWFGLGTAPGATCSALKTYQIPEGALRTVTGTSGMGERVKNDSENFVQCDVRPVQGSTTNYNVSLKYQGGEIGNLVASGVVSDSDGADANSDGNLDVTLVTGQFSLSQDDCTLEIVKDALLPGAIWIQNLRCNNLRDPSSPNIVCAGLGGVIFENCSH